MFLREASNSVRLAASDFLFEWRLTSCLVLALAAVLAPLLVLFGLKYGDHRGNTRTDGRKPHLSGDQTHRRWNLFA